MYAHLLMSMLSLFLVQNFTNILKSLCKCEGSYRDLDGFERDLDFFPYPPSCWEKLSPFANLQASSIAHFKEGAFFHLLQLQISKLIFRLLGYSLTDYIYHFKKANILFRSSSKEYFCLDLKFHKFYHISRIDLGIGSLFGVSS